MTKSAAALVTDPSPESNAAEWSVSELAGALRRTLEDAFGFVRLRGEISGYRGPSASGHVYFCLKDDTAKIDAVLWKGTFSRLRFKPSEGLEVIATGKITTFANKSSYQIVIDQLEPAGVGALMALLESRKRALAAEGLFDPSRKRALPYLPQVIGVVTSPTGAVIRDILHRLDDRFPRHVIVWPVRVQGDSSAEEIAAAIRGFNALPLDGPICRPDLLIVARGGGSIEDLWSFNEEVVVRAAAESRIPLISAVGHETDTTLIDLAADRRAPTPTGAAEMAVPVRAELIMAVGDLARRHGEAALRALERRRGDLRSASRALPTGDALLALPRQRLDGAGAKLKPYLAQTVRNSEARLLRALNGLTRNAPAAMLAKARGRLDAVDHRPRQALERAVALQRERLVDKTKRLSASREALLRAERLRLDQRRGQVLTAGQRLALAWRSQAQRRVAGLGGLAQLFDSLNYRSVLARGFALVRDEAGRPLRGSGEVRAGEALAIEFADGTAQVVGAGQAAGVGSPARTGAQRRSRTPAGTREQGVLFDELAQGAE